MPAPINALLADVALVNEIEVARVQTLDARDTAVQAADESSLAAGLLQLSAIEGVVALKADLPLGKGAGVLYGVLDEGTAYRSDGDDGWTPVFTFADVPVSSTDALRALPGFPRGTRSVRGVGTYEWLPDGAATPDGGAVLPAAGGGVWALRTGEATPEVYGAEPGTLETLGNIYATGADVLAERPYLHDDVFRLRPEREDWNTGTPADPTTFLTTFSGIQAAIEHSRAGSSDEAARVTPGTYDLERRLAIRGAVRAHFDVRAKLRAAGVDFPQNTVLIDLPTFAPFTGATNFVDEHYIGRIPAVSFSDTEAAVPAGALSVTLPIALPAEITAGSVVHLRRRRTPHDSVEPAWSGRRRVKTATNNGDGTCTLAFYAPLPRVAAPMTITAASNAVNTTGTTYTLALTAPTTHQLKKHNDRPTLAIPLTRTTLTFSGGAVMEVLTKADKGATSLTLKLVSGTAPVAGETAVWGTESWLFLVSETADDAVLTGTLNVERSPFATANLSSARIVYAAHGRRDELMVKARGFDRALTLTETHRSHFPGAVTSELPGSNRKARAVDLQGSDDNVIDRAVIFGTTGGLVQFETSNRNSFRYAYGLLDSRYLGSALVDNTDFSHGNVIDVLVVEGSHDTYYTYADPDEDAEGVQTLVPMAADTYGRAPHPVWSSPPAGTQEAARAGAEVRHLDLRADASGVRPYYVRDRIDYTSPRYSHVSTLDRRAQVSRVVEMTGAEPYVVRWAGFPRRSVVRMHADGAGITGATLTFIRGGVNIPMSFVVASGAAVDLHPALVTDEGGGSTPRRADQVLQLWTGTAFDEVGYLVARPPTGGWPAGSKLEHTSELFTNGRLQAMTAEPLVKRTFRLTPYTTGAQTLTLISGPAFSPLSAPERLVYMVARTDAAAAGSPASVNIQSDATGSFSTISGTSLTTGGGASEWRAAFNVQLPVGPALRVRSTGTLTGPTQIEVDVFTIR